MPTALAVIAMTTVTGTLVDRFGTRWFNAIVQARLQPWINTGPQYTVDGIPVNPEPPFVITDANGSFSIGLPSNMDIAPAGSSWQFIIIPETERPPVTLDAVYVGHNQMDISALFTEVVTAIEVQSFPIPRAQGDSEVAPSPRDGQLYFNTGLQKFKYSSNGTWLTLGDGGGGGGMEWPPTGVAVSTGSAWDTSIPASDLARLSAAANIFTGYVTGSSVIATGSIFGARSNATIVDRLFGSSNNGRILSSSGDGSTIGGLYLAGTTGAFTNTLNYLVCQPSGITLGLDTTINGNLQAGIGNFSQSVGIGSGTCRLTDYQGRLYIAGSSNGWLFQNSSGAGVINFNPDGSASFNGGITAGLGITTPSITSNGPITTQGANGILQVLGYLPAGSPGPSRVLIDFYQSTGRMSAIGANSSTVGNFQILGITSGNETTINYLNMVPSGITFGIDTIINGNLNINGSVKAYGFSIPDGSRSNVQIGIGSNGTDPQMWFVRAGIGQWSIYGVDNGLMFTDQSGNIRLQVDTSTATTVHGGFTTTGAISSTGSGGYLVDGSIRMSYNAGNGYFDCVGTGAGRGLIVFRQFAGGTSAEIDSLIFDGSGNATFVGTITGTAKNFRIPHPLDPKKYLIHSCLEGPECGVFYRGEGETVDGKTVIELPDYFEALTLKTRRTVQLTALVDDDNPVFGGQLAAGRIKDGKFIVYSVDASQSFYWEVKAVRADIDELEVIRPKPAPAPAS